MSSLATLRRYLVSRRVGEMNHSDRTLLDHLQGTYDVLRSWNCRDEVCVAGLFHSVYGTPDYKVNAISLEDRAEIVDVIGEQAEELVFQFSLLGHQGTVKLYSSSGADHAVQGLLDLCLANFIEQEPALEASMVRDLLVRDHQFWQCAIPYLTAPARDACKRLFYKHSFHLGKSYEPD